MNLKKTLIATTLIVAFSASFALAGGLGQKGHKKNGPPPAGVERMNDGGNPDQNQDGRPPRKHDGKRDHNRDGQPAGAGENGQPNGDGQPNANDGQPNGNGGNNGQGFQRPVDLIGPELGVTGAQFATCFEAVSPAPQGTEPTVEREQANKAVLLPCLQAINPSITNDLLDTVTGKYRPNN